MDNSLPNRQEVFYTPDYKLRVSFRTAARTLAKDVYHFRALVWQYVRRDFVASYRGTFLGFFWKLILPLVPISVYIALHLLGVFSAATAMPRPLYVAVGLTLWELWAQTLLVCLNRLNSESSLLKKVRVPLSVVYLTGIGQILFDSLVRMGLLAVLLVIFEIPFSWSWLLLPILVLPLFLFGAGLGIFLSFFAVFSRDVNNVTTVVIRYGLFASAVIFPLPMQGTIGTAVRLNPLYHLVDGTRTLLVRQTLPHPLAYGICLIAALGIFLLAAKKTCSMEERLVWAL